MSTIEKTFDVPAPCQNKCPDCKKTSRAVTDIHTCTPDGIPSPATINALDADNSQK